LAIHAGNSNLKPTVRFIRRKIKSLTQAAKAAVKAGTITLTDITAMTVTMKIATKPSI
jgi:hypothetical protein